MTTVACDGSCMAGDGQAEASETILTKTREKVCRLPDGSIFGSAGRSADGIALAKWLVDGGKPPKLERMGALRLFPDGTLHYINELCQPTVIDAPCAVGTGMGFAIGAMDAGATAERAVEIAMARDPFSGGMVTVVHR